MERQLRGENTRLLTELNDTQLDLEDSKRSRRDLQQQLNMVTQMMGQSNADADQLRVCYGVFWTHSQTLMDPESKSIYYCAG